MYKCTIELLVDNDGTLLGMFLQNSRMRTEFEHFPEVKKIIVTLRQSDSSSVISTEQKILFFFFISFNKILDTFATNLLTDQLMG